MWLGFRALFWTFAFPGLLAFYLPWRFFGVRETDINLANVRHLVALLTIGAGAILLFACIWEFARRGKGTLSPADPPRHLVVSGLYRFVRNPMYLAVTTIVLGEVLLTWSGRLFTYWVAWFSIVNVFVIAYEEPALERQFADEYARYARHVGRWWPRLTPWRA